MVGNNKIKNVSDHNSTQFWRSVAIGAIILIMFLSLPHLCAADCSHSHHPHDHDHHHHKEPASFKWSKEANDVHEDHQHNNHDHQHHHHGEDHLHGDEHHPHTHHERQHTRKAPKTTQSKI